VGNAPRRQIVFFSLVTLFSTTELQVTYPLHLYFASLFVPSYKICRQMTFRAIRRVMHVGRPKYLRVSSYIGGKGFDDDAHLTVKLPHKPIRGQHNRLRVEHFA